MAELDDVEAFAALFERHRVSVYRAALALTGDPGASEEVVMDTFGRAYTHRRRLRTDVSPLPWLHKVALNLCYSRLARRRLRRIAFRYRSHACHSQPDCAARRVRRDRMRQVRSRRAG